jgi:hypothetical protein
VPVGAPSSPSLDPPEAAAAARGRGGGGRGKRRAVANEEEEVRGNDFGSRRVATSLRGGGGECGRRDLAAPAWISLRQEGAAGALDLAAPTSSRRVKRGLPPPWISPPRRAAAAPSNLQLGGSRRWRRRWR